MNIFCSNLCSFWLRSLLKVGGLYCLLVAPIFAQTVTKKLVKKPSVLATNKENINRGSLKLTDYEFYVVIPNFTQSNFAQTNRQGKSFNYPLGNRVIDIRTGATVQTNWPSGNVYWLKGKQKLIVSKEKGPVRNEPTLIISSSGSIENVIDPKMEIDKNLYTGNISPDFSKVLFQAKQDLWLSDIDIQSGQLGSPKQVTRFGFSNPSYIWGWHKDHIGFGTSFWVNTKTGDVQDISSTININPSEAQINPDYYFSPDRRFATFSWISMSPSTPNNAGNLIDLATNKTLNLLDGLKDIKGIDFGRSSNAMYWLDNRRLIMGYQGIDGQKTHLYTVAEDGSFKRESIKNIPARKFNLEFLPSISSDARQMFSPDSLRYLAKPDCNSFPCDWFVVEPLTAKLTQIDKGNLFVSWIDNDHLLYSKANTSATEQGTYIYDLKSKSRKKLFSYTIEGDGLPQGQCHYNAKANYLLFTTQDILWRCRPDGSELTELLKESNAKYFLSPFMTSVIDQ